MSEMPIETRGMWTGYRWIGRPYTHGYWIDAAGERIEVVRAYSGDWLIHGTDATGQKVFTLDGSSSRSRTASEAVRLANSYVRTRRAGAKRDAMNAAIDGILAEVNGDEKRRCTRDVHAIIAATAHTLFQALI